MSAYEIPNNRFSAVAHAAVKCRRFVSINSDEEGLTATAATVIVGASMNEVTAAGQVLEIADGIVMVEADAVCTAGTYAASTATGLATPYVAPNVATNVGPPVTVDVPAPLLAGTFMTGGVKGQLVAVKIG